MKKTIIISGIILLGCFFQQSMAQNGSDTLAPIVKENQADLKKLKKIKISGFIQGQYQKAESKGIETTSGDNFPANIDQKFSIRRGRLKTTYSGKMSEAGIQFDVTLEKGVNIKEAYYKFTEPVFKALSLQAGLFNRPFGFEVGYSSTAMEAPERARVTQTILAGETDMGFCIIFQLPKENPFSAFRVDAGLFNGTNIKADFDNIKDFIGRISYNNNFLDKYLNLGAGFSYYYGGTWNFSSKYYKWENNAFQSVAIDSLGVLNRKYLGADVQLNLNNAFGQTILRGEIIMGTQPSLSKTTKTMLDTAGKGALYLRDFSGGYVLFAQNIGKSKHQIAAKYEWYDPNTKVKNTDIGVAANGTKKGDIAYTNLGFGWNYNYDDNLKFTAFYDMSLNEKTALKGYTEDIKDNVLTLRIQYKF
jgi:phosphate-selective porin